MQTTYKVLYLSLLSNTDRAFSTQYSSILPQPQPSFPIPDTANAEQRVLAYRHLTCRHMLKEHTTVRKESFLFLSSLFFHTYPPDFFVSTIR